MKVEIISIGDEILIGQIVNSNAAFIAEKLTEIGYDVEWITTVGDNSERLLEAIETAEKRTDVIIATGGLGPTHDDITKKVFAHYFNSELILDEQIYYKIKERFRRRRIRMAKINKEQAMVPHNATIIENPVGTAAGLLFEKPGKYFFVMPGVPAEMVTMTENFVIPFLKQRLNKIFKKRVIHTTGIPESTLYEKLGDIEPLEKLVKIAFLPTYSGVNIRLTVQGEREEFCQQRIDRVEKVFQEKFHQHIWGYDEETLENAIGKLFISQHKTFAIAEYGTGGNLALQLTGTPLAEQFFIQGFTFAAVQPLVEFFDLDNKIKSVDQILNRKICEELSRKVARLTKADIAMAILHQDNRDVTTYVAITDDNNTLSQRYIFTFHPSMNIQRITATALKLLYQHLNQQKMS